MRALWTWLTGRRSRPAPVVPEVAYDPNRDPIVRHFRAEKLAAQREVQRLERRRRRNFMEAELVRKGAADARR